MDECKTYGHYIYIVTEGRGGMQMARANAADTLCVTTDESGGGHLTLHAISNSNNIFKRDEFDVVPSGTIHNAYIVGDRIFASYYTKGLLVADISDPDDISFVGQYDMSLNYSAGAGGLRRSGGGQPGLDTRRLYLPVRRRELSGGPPFRTRDGLGLRGGRLEA